MENLYVIANKYYKKLESFEAYGGKSNKSIPVLFFSVVFFVVFFILLIASEEGTPRYNMALIAAFFCELVFVLTLNYIQKVRKEKLLENNNCKTLGEVRVKLLSGLFGATQNEFSELTEQIFQSYERMHLLSGKRRLTDGIFSMFYQKDSKAEVIGLLAILVSVVMTIFSKLSLDIASFSWENFGVIIIIIIVALVLTYGLFKAIALFLRMFVFLFNAFFLKDGDRNKTTLRYLINDLNEYQQFKKVPKIKVKVSSKKGTKSVLSYKKS